MLIVARVLAALIALFGIVMGLAFLGDPAKMGSVFFLKANGVDGLAVLRADMGAFFLVGGILSALAAWKRDATLMLTPILLYGVALIGRGLTAIIDGATPASTESMFVEAGIVAAALFARHVFKSARA